MSKEQQSRKAPASANIQGGVGVVVADRGLAGRVVGLDIERLDRVRLALASRILTHSEEQALEGLGDAAAQRRLAIAFSVKEAFYKAHHQLEPRWLAFDVISVEHGDGNGRRGVRIRIGGAPGSVDPARLDGAEVVIDERSGVITAAVSLIAR